MSTAAGELERGSLEGGSFEARRANDARSFYLQAVEIS
jgi:hypothetical protein